jgi:hypothetical protein
VEPLEDRCLLSGGFQPPHPTPEFKVTESQHHRPPIIPHLGQAPRQAFSTIPANGDLNPYSVSFVPLDYHGGGVLHPGDILVDNFNDSANVQGTGSTIVRIDTAGHRSLFFQGNKGFGFTGAMAILKAGFVIVGSLPDPDGTAATIRPGSLLILNSHGHVVGHIAGPHVKGPWGLAVKDQGDQAEVFVANVLNGTVIRIGLKISHGLPVVQSETQIASGYPHNLDNNVIVGPSGLAYDATKDVLYVASQVNDSVFAIAHASLVQNGHGQGHRIFHDTVHFHGPLDLVLLPNGDLFAAQSDSVTADPAQPSELVEFTTTGKFVGQFSLDPNTGGAFAAGVLSTGHRLRIAATDDNNSIPNTTTPNPGPGLFVWTFREVHGVPVIP